MKKKIIVMTVLALSATLTHAGVALNIYQGYLYKSNGITALPENSTMVLLCDANNNGSFGDLTQATNSWTADSGDVVVARWAFNYNADIGFGDAVVTFLLEGGIGPNSKLMLAWYDKAYSADATGPGVGVNFGTFRTDNVQTGSMTSWITPADGATVNLSFLTANAGGDNAESLGAAQYQTISGGGATEPVATDPANTPYSWLAQYGLTNYNADAVADVDGDGAKTWQEYIAGTDPTNAASCFRITENPRNVLNWSTVTGRVYSVYWSTNLLSGFQCLQSNIPSTQSSYTNITSARSSYYKLDVRKLDVP